MNLKKTLQPSLDLRTINTNMIIEQLEENMNQRDLLADFKMSYEGVGDIEERDDANNALCDDRSLLSLNKLQHKSLKEKTFHKYLDIKKRDKLLQQWKKI